MNPNTYLEAERSRLLREVIVLRDRLKAFARGFRTGDDLDVINAIRDTKMHLRGAEARYERYCCEVLHRDPWPKPIDLTITPEQRQALAGQQVRSAPRRNVAYIRKVIP